MGQAASKPRRHPYIVRTPGACGGRARIDGTRIPVWLVVSFVLRRGTSPEEFVEAYPRITLAQVYDAISYSYDHRSEVERDLRDQEEAWQQQSKRGSR